MKKTVTLPKQYWNKIESLAEDIEGGLSDALFMVVDLGLKALDNKETINLLGGENSEEDAGDYGPLVEPIVYKEFREKREMKSPK